MPGGDLLLLALIALGSIWWLGVEYGAAVTKRIVVVKETVREVVREVQMEAPKSGGAGSSGAVVVINFGVTFSSFSRTMSPAYITTMTNAIFFGTPYQPQQSAPIQGR